MKIRHEAPETHLDWKVRAPLVIETPAGKSVHIQSWSLAGLVWPAEEGECPKTGTLSVPFQGVDVRFPVRLSDKNDDGIVELKGLSGRQREALALFYRSLLSGKMASNADMITSLDTPVDLVPMEQTEEEQAEQPVKFIPRPVRVFFNIVTYLLIATMVVGIIGNNIFTNLDRIDIQHGRVIAPMTQAFPSQGGFVQSIEVHAGQEVQAGDLLIRLRDPATLAKLEQAEAELAVAEAEHDRILGGLQELARFDQEENAALRMTVAARLYTSFVGGGEFDDMRRQWLALRQVDKALAQSYDPVGIVRDLMQGEASRSAAKVETQRARRDAHLDTIESNHIRAPSDGTVHEILVRPGQLFGAQETDLTFESAEPRTTVGWVSEKFSETIFIGMPATIGLNEQGEKITLQGAVVDVRAADHPERPGEFGIMVSVAATSLDPAGSKIRLRLGAPVNLEAKRQLGQRLRTWIKSWRG